METINPIKATTKLTLRRSVLHKRLEPYLYLAPCLLLFGVFVFFPFFKTIYISLGLTDAHGRVAQIVGLQNYGDVFRSKDFIDSIVVTLEFVPLVTIPSILLGLALALIANAVPKGMGFVKTLYALPMAVSSASASILWMIMFHPTIGILNTVLHTSIGWLIDTKWALISVALVTVWLNLGVNFIFILSGLKNVPMELMESASIDGAGFFRKLFRIIIPMLSPTLFFVFFIDVMGAFQAFGQVNIMTHGGPGNSTNLFVYSIYRNAFFNGRFDTACTQSIVLFLIMLMISLLQFKYEKKGVFYS